MFVNALERRLLAITLPVKFAVFPESSTLIVTFGAITLPIKLAVLASKLRLIFALPLTTTLVKYVEFESAIPSAFDDIV